MARPGTVFEPPGSAAMRPTVATASGRARAAASAASTSLAAATRASRRPAIGAVPAWSARPSMTKA